LGGVASVYIGVMRVYPKMNDYLKDKKYTVVFSMEIYDFPGSKISYAFPIQK
jgi:hypothetical protein